MKKLILILIGTFLFASCGPKRLGCGPKRCDATEKVDTIKTIAIVMLTKEASPKNLSEKILKYNSILHFNTLGGILRSSG